MSMTEVVPFGFPEHTAKPPCQWGSCGHCSAGRCDRCQFRRDPSRTHRQSAHTQILDKAGRVLFPVVSVFVQGEISLGWVCSCHRADHTLDQGDGQLVLV